LRKADWFALGQIVTSLSLLGGFAVTLVSAIRALVPIQPQLKLGVRTGDGQTLLLLENRGTDTAFDLVVTLELLRVSSEPPFGVDSVRVLEPWSARFVPNASERPGRWVGQVLIADR